MCNVKFVPDMIEKLRFHDVHVVITKFDFFYKKIPRIGYLRNGKQKLKAIFNVCVRLVSVENC